MFVLERERETVRAGEREIDTRNVKKRWSFDGKVRDLRAVV